MVEFVFVSVKICGDNMLKLLNNLCGFIILILIPLNSALYFHIGETERKCFIEEIPDETTVIGLYRFIFSLNRVLMHDFNVNYVLHLRFSEL